MQRLNDILGRTGKSKPKAEKTKPVQKIENTKSSVSQQISASIRLQTMPYSEYLETPEWKQKRDQALRVAEYRCQVCNSSETLNVHHRTYERRGREALADLTVLCKSCHDLFHNGTENKCGFS